MTYLIWALLNIGLLLFFIFACFRVTKLLRKKLGLFYTIIFVCGLFLSAVSHPPNVNEKNWEFNSADSLTRNSTTGIDVNLEKTLISKYELSILYGQDKFSKLNIPISASSSTEGFIIGTNWKPLSIRVATTDDNNKFEFLVYGIVEWKLFGATIYSQAKSYKGFTQIK